MKVKLLAVAILSAAFAGSVAASGVPVVDIALNTQTQANLMANIA